MKREGFSKKVKDTNKEIRPDLHKVLTEEFPKLADENYWNKIIEEAHDLVGLEYNSCSNELVRNWGLNKKDTPKSKRRGSLKAAIIVYYWLHFKHTEIANRLDLLIFGQKFDINIDPPPERIKPSKPSAPFEWPPYVSEKDIEAAHEDSGIWLNAYNHHTIKLSGRKVEKDYLTQWMEDDQPFLMLSIIGPSGSGKTRLISEWMKDYVPIESTTDWDAGIVRIRDKTPWLDEEKWQLDRNTLIVIDYSYDYGAVINSIKERALKQDKHNVRLLILDHFYPDDKTPDPTFGKAMGDENIFDLEKKHIFKEKEYLELKPEEDDSKLLADIITSVASHLDRDCTPQDEEIKKAVQALYKMGERMENPESIRHPLFAALMGQAIAVGETYDNWTRRHLIKRYFDRGERIPWKTLDQNGYVGLGKWIGAYICVATLQRGIPASILEQCDLPDSAFEKQPPKKQDVSHGVLKETICQFAMKLVSANPKHGIIKPYEPDILGEAFLLMFLENNFTDKDCKATFLSMLQQPRFDKTQEQVANNFAEVIERLCSNLANDDQSLPQVKKGWEHLEQFLQPDLFEKNTPLRHTVAISRIGMIWQWQKACQKQKGVQDQATLNLAHLTKCIELDDLLYEIEKNLYTIKQVLSLFGQNGGIRQTSLPPRIEKGY